MSRTASESGRLIRTSTSAPPRRTRDGVALRRTIARASFAAAGTLSSRSIWMQSAPRSCALRDEAIDVGRDVQQRPPDRQRVGHATALALGCGRLAHHAGVEQLLIGIAP